MKRVVKIPFPTDPLVAGPETLGKAVRSSRTEQGLTIEEAAMTIGVAKQTLSDIEAGKSTVSLGIVLKVATELGVSLFVAPARERERIQSLICGMSK
ncbi:MAG TPA: helix-turn-helix transcriptional regulator [Noviherbaspirillum sp.]|uniref:helix-turn-helix domain-containing protein n=1 Tax=Noviherbaspirillum sp. TaxID=1926288 RepID=UPI002D707BB4|nr:helix-turn-helix transcriptional regulator [Noviherbaspirillum sp.]HYD93823.1 helix-turn-helix transcriptional regulator [Noviherbaspirillum sp.]